MNSNVKLFLSYICLLTLVEIIGFPIQVVFENEKMFINFCMSTKVVHKQIKPASICKYKLRWLHGFKRADK